MKVLIAGLGAIGQRHVRNLRTLRESEIEIMAFRQRRLPHVITEKFEIERGVDVAAKYNIEEFDSLETALGTKPDITFICNPTSQHMSVALAVARAGSHLFIEKPISHNVDDVDQLIHEVEKRELKATVGYQFRFHPCVRMLGDLLANKAIGNVIAVRMEVGEYLPATHPYEDYRLLYNSRADLGGGVVLSQIHELDYLTWLFGMPLQVFALGGKLSNLDVDVEDTASILMEYCLDDRKIPVHLHQDFVQSPPSRWCEIIGDHGKIFIEFLTPNLKRYSRTGVLLDDFSPAGFERNQLFLDELQDFLRCVENNEQPRVSLSDGVKSLRVALAAKESMATGKPVNVQ